MCPECTRLLDEFSRVIAEQLRLVAAHEDAVSKGSLAADEIAAQLEAIREQRLATKSKLTDHFLLCTVEDRGAGAVPGPATAASGQD